MTDSEPKGAGILAESAYLSITYDEASLPKTAYPRKLAAYLSSRFFSGRGKLLDVGCGRGDFLRAFADLGYEVAGVDISPAAPDMAPGLDVRVLDLERETMISELANFDYVFNKSVLEHTRDPVKVMREMLSALKPGGHAIIMVPAWETGYRGSFYIDHTHITPFTLPGLENAMRLAGFEVIHAQYFWQLPFSWSRPWLMPLLWLIRILPIPYRPMHKAPWPDSINKLVWFSNEAMLLCVGKKLTT